MRVKDTNTDKIRSCRNISRDTAKYSTRGGWVVDGLASKFEHGHNLVLLSISQICTKSKLSGLRNWRVYLKEEVETLAS